MSKTETHGVSVFDLSKKWRKYPIYALERKYAFNGVDFCFYFFAREKLSLNGHVLRKEHANKGPFHTYMLDIDKNLVSH